MKLLSIQLNNFRQFRGITPEIRFAVEKPRNVTVFFGTNGAGKTALLNAFTWTLYGTFTRGFILPETIVNKAAIREASPGVVVDAWVELKFEHNGSKHKLRKRKSVVRITDENELYSPRGEDEVTLFVAGDDGHWRAVTQGVADVIGRVLPVDLHTYFFFDGERIERIVQPNESEQADIENATKKLLGIEILERAEKHLNYAKQHFEKELREIGDPQTQELIDKITDSDNKLTANKNRALEIARNIEAFRNQKSETEARYRQLNEVKTIQQRRDDLTEDLQKRKASLELARQELATHLNGRAYQVFLGEAITAYKDMVETLRSKGELPAGIKRQFVEDLLEKQRCICNRSLSLTEAPDALRAVEDWKMKAGLADVEETAIRMSGEVKQIEQGVPEFWRLLDQYEVKRSSDRQEISRIELELDEISEKLRNSPKEEVALLEKKLIDLDGRINVLLGELADKKHENQHLESILNELNKNLDTFRVNEERQILAQRRRAATFEALARIRESCNLFEISFRLKLIQKIRELFGKISFKPFTPDFIDKYSLGLIESAGGASQRVPAGQGESQILSLCFIGAMIAIAREHHAQKERLPGPDSSSYPLVMDSPFGSLGPTYRRQVADHISILADQVVVLVTNTQWRGEVEQSLSERVGKAYLFKYFTPKEEFEKEVIDFRGHNYELISTSPNAFEYTEIVEV